MELEAAERAMERHKKKKQSKLKEKNLSKVARNLDVPKEAFGADEDPSLFNINTIKSKKVKPPSVLITVVVADLSVIFPASVRN